MISEMDSTVAALLHPEFFPPCLLLVHFAIGRLESATRDLLESFGVCRTSIDDPLATPGTTGRRRVGLPAVIRLALILLTLEPLTESAFNQLRRVILALKKEKKRAYATL